MALKNKILRNILSIWTKLDQNRGLIRSNNTENSAKIDDLTARKAKNTPQPQRRTKTPRSAQKRHFHVLTRNFQ
jgi:hypothetical protein